MSMNSHVYILEECTAYNITNYIFDQARAYQILAEVYPHLNLWSLRNRLYGEMSDIGLGISIARPEIEDIINHFAEHGKMAQSWNTKAKHLTEVLHQYKRTPQPEQLDQNNLINQASKVLKEAGISLGKRISQLCEISEDIPHLGPQRAQEKLFELLSDLEGLQEDLMAGLRHENVCLKG